MPPNGADFASFLAAYRRESMLRDEEYDLIPAYRDLAVAWRMRVASCYALRQDSTGRWPGSWRAWAAGLWWCGQDGDGREGSAAVVPQAGGGCAVQKV